MPYMVLRELCTGCGSCVEACPAEAIQCDGGVASIDEHLCILCGICQSSCSHDAVLLDGEPYGGDVRAVEGALGETFPGCC